MNTAGKTVGILLLNLGTPDSPEPEDVARYLKQFLMDPKVIDIPWIFRWIFVHLLIVPKRKFTSSAAYKKIWSSKGSPLLFHLEDLTSRVRSLIGSGYRVEMAMRYGNPSIAKGLKALRDSGCAEIRVLSLYPQYAESSTRTAEDECRRQAKKLGIEGRLRFVRPFYADAGYIGSTAELMRPILERENPDHVLFSFHGLPERHIKKTDHSGGAHCFVDSSCCENITNVNRDCYRAQSFATAKLLRDALRLPIEKTTVSFQSRLGRTPWIRPFTDQVLDDLARRGVKKLAVACPSFTTDCLETVEEIGIRARAQFINAGGTELIRIPCLNADPRWAVAVMKMVKDEGALSPAR